MPNEPPYAAPILSAAISAIVPARNEEPSIAGCIKSLAHEPEIAEILVVNDQSTDKTAEIVRGLMTSIPNLRLLETQGVPVGWVGKNYAVSLGAKEAKNPWLLFTDADAEHEPGAAAKALQVAQETNAAVVSFSPEQVLEKWYEKALIPFIFCRLARKFSYDAVNDPSSPDAAANGQFLMIRRDAQRCFPRDGLHVPMDCASSAAPGDQVSLRLVCRRLAPHFPPDQLRLGADA